MLEKIVRFLEVKQEASPKEISEHLGISRQMTHRYIKSLLEKELIYKIGSPPNVFYKLKENKTNQDYDLSQSQIEFLNTNFIEITNTGQLLRGLQAFEYWCEKRNQALEKTLPEFEKTIAKYNTYYDGEFINGTEKLQNTKGFKTIYLTDVYYLDFYAIERFGKTKLGKLLHFGKQSQSKNLINEIIEITKPSVLKLIAKLKVDAIGYIPPTINREVQIMKMLENGYSVALPKIQLVKVKGDIIVPQKALSKLSDRIENTQQSIMVADNRKFESVLLIDDAVGSGATLNEVAGKLIRRGLAKKVYGLAITGSFKGFEVISEA